MVKKYVLVINDNTKIAIKHEETTAVLTIGGRNALRGKMNFLADNWFGAGPSLQFKQTTKAKGRFVFRCSRENFDKVIKELLNQHYTVIDVKSHGGLMR